MIKTKHDYDKQDLIILRASQLGFAEWIFPHEIFSSKMFPLWEMGLRKIPNWELDHDQMQRV